MNIGVKIILGRAFCFVKTIVFHPQMEEGKRASPSAGPAHLCALGQGADGLQGSVLRQ